VDCAYSVVSGSARVYKCLFCLKNELKREKNFCRYEGKSLYIALLQVVGDGDMYIIASDFVNAKYFEEISSYLALK
jgi:hypothetical protein